MKKTMISELKEGMIVDSTFLIKGKTFGTGKTGKDYLTLIIGDKSGDMDARVWDNAKDIDSMVGVNNIVQVRGRVNNFKGKLQISIDEIRWIDRASVEIADYMIMSPRLADDMFYELKMLMSTIENEHLKKLVDLFFANEQMTNLLKVSSAAKTIHHAYSGGLLEHTLNVVRLSDMIVSVYDGVDRSLLLTSALFHDIGKIRELGGDLTTEYTDEGRLIGHIVIGTEIIEELISEIKNFPRELALLLKHSILSHHGELEYGSPKRPKTIEAIILHYVEDMDSKVAGIKSLIKKESGVEGDWTSYHPSYERYFYKKHYFQMLDKDKENKKDNE
ncbi:MAG: HD domain-containing protein [Deltaproteobacteria bacterium]|nr:HD domain-containing protein [Deltaproteobacteria bacterium]